jgi:hypothetical protein
MRLLMIVPLLVLAAPALADDPTYMMSRCIKAQPNKSGDYEKFMMETTRKSMQVRADEGSLAAWVFAHSVIPGGGLDSTCDFLLINVHKGFPPERVPIDPYFAKAKVTVTREQWYAKLAEQSRLVRVELWRGLDELGTMEKGNYFRLGLFKVPPARAEGWLAAEGKPVKAWHDARIKAGELRGWQAHELVIPAGTAQPYNLRTLEVFPDWNAIGRPSKLRQPASKAELVRTELFQVIDVVRPTKS